MNNQLKVCDKFWNRPYWKLPDQLCGSAHWKLYNQFYEPLDKQLKKQLSEKLIENA